MVMIISHGYSHQCQQIQDYKLCDGIYTNKEVNKCTSYIVAETNCSCV